MYGEQLKLAQHFINSSKTSAEKNNRTNMISQMILLQPSIITFKNFDKESDNQIFQPLQQYSENNKESVIYLYLDTYSVTRILMYIVLGGFHKNCSKINLNILTSPNKKIQKQINDLITQIKEVYNGHPTIEIKHLTKFKLNKGVIIYNISQNDTELMLLCLKNNISFVSWKNLNGHLLVIYSDSENKKTYCNICIDKKKMRFEYKRNLKIDAFRKTIMHIWSLKIKKMAPKFVLKECEGFIAAAKLLNPNKYCMQTLTFLIELQKKNRNNNKLYKDLISLSKSQLPPPYPLFNHSIISVCTPPYNILTKFDAHETFFSINFIKNSWDNNSSHKPAIKKCLKKFLPKFLKNNTYLNNKLIITSSTNHVII